MSDEERRKEMLIQDHDTITRIDTVVNGMANDIKHIANSITIANREFDKRIRALEDFQRDFNTTWKTMIGIASAVGVVITVIVELFAGVFSHK